MEVSQQTFDFSATGDVDSVSTVDICVDLVYGMVGDVEFRLEDWHAIGIAPDFTTVIPTSFDGAKVADITWHPNTVGYLPPNMRQEAACLVAADTVFVRFSDRFFQDVALETYKPWLASPREMSAVHDPIASEMMRLIGRLVAEEDGGAQRLMVESIGTALAVRFQQMQGPVHAAADAPYPEGLPENRLRRVIDYVAANIRRDIRLVELANIAALSPFHFTRAFKRSMNMTPVRYVWTQRIEHAKVHLRRPELPIAAIAYECGFSSQSHFNTLFKKMVGVTPARFREGLLVALLLINLHMALDALELIHYVDFF